MPPRQAHLCLDIGRFISDDLGLDLSNKSLVVALSGGVDSTALLLTLLGLAPRLGLKLCAAHLDHGLRPEAAAEAEAVRALCAAQEVRYIVETAPVREMSQSQGMGLEEAGRKLRYAFLERVRVEQNADWICLGHHLNDLAEDVLMRLIRGTGWPGLGGMQAFAPQRRLVRPLLLTPKDRLREFVSALEICWQEDKSNSDPLFMRNRVRQQILPLFLEENPNFLQNVADLWQLARLDQEYFKTAAARLWSSTGESLPEGQGLLPGSVLNEAPQALRLRLYKDELDALGPGQALHAGLRQLDAAWEARRTGKKFQFPGDKVALIQREGIFFSYSG